MSEPESNWNDSFKVEYASNSCQTEDCCGNCQEPVNEQEDQNEEVREEWFFLVYHMHIQPSEAEALPEFKRKWLISRFIAQKQAEKEMMDQMRHKHSGIVTPDLIQEIERTRNV